MILRDSLIGTRNKTKDVDFSTLLDAWILDLRLTFELQKYFFEGLQSLSLLRFYKSRNQLKNRRLTPCISCRNVVVCFVVSEALNHKTNDAV